MILITVILLTAFIISPLLDLTLKENALFFGKVIVYVLALVYVGYMLIAGAGKV